MPLGEVARPPQDVVTRFLGYQDAAKLNLDDTRADPEVQQIFMQFKDALEAGTIRPATKVNGIWRANPDVKQAILFGFKLGVIEIMTPPGGLFIFSDKAFPLREWDPVAEEQRIVPGGTAVRSGSHLEPGITIMPPAYVNVGAWVGRGSMVDSHALVGSCAQIGKNVHLSAAAQVGGVLEPVGANPVIVEDEAFIGGGCGLYDGVVIGERAVLAAGVILTGTSTLIDYVNEAEYKGTPESPLVVPPGAVVVPGARALPGDFARSLGLAISTPIIIKHRDASTDAKVALESALR